LRVSLYVQEWTRAYAANRATRSAGNPYRHTWTPLSRGTS